MEIREIAQGSAEMQALEEINIEAIPENERCSLQDMAATGASVFCIDADREPVGFMAVRKYRNRRTLKFGPFLAAGGLIWILFSATPWFLRMIQLLRLGKS